MQVLVKKGTINTFHAMGMVVSYDWVMEVRKGLAISVSKRFAKDGVVLPSNIKRGVFTTGAVDNIDESGRTELHGTAISLTNHLTHENTGISPPALRLDAPENATVHLPEDFAIGHMLTNMLEKSLFPQCLMDQLCQRSQQIHGQEYLMIHGLTTSTTLQLKRMESFKKCH